MIIELPKDNSTFEVRDVVGKMIISELSAMKHYFEVDAPDKFSRYNYCSGFLAGLYLGHQLSTKVYNCLADVCHDIMRTKGHINLDELIMRVEDGDY